MSVVPQKIGRYKLKGALSHNKTFGAPAILPPTLNRTPRFVKDQGFSNYCTAAARSAAASYFFGSEMSFEYMTAKEGQVAGTPIYNGANPNTADTAGEEYGFLPQGLCPLSFKEDGWSVPADWRNYNKSLDEDAVENTMVPFNVYPDYQSIKAALVSGNPDNAVVVANGFWYQEFNDSGALLPVPKQQPISRHSYIFIDYKTIHGTEYLVAQLSQGTDFGYNGVFYMSEECVNYIFSNPSFNGLGCTIGRKGVPNPIQTKISLLHRLVDALGRLYSKLIGL